MRAPFSHVINVVAFKSAVNLLRFCHVATEIELYITVKYINLST